MRKNKMIAWILALALLLPCISMVGYAANDLNFSVAVSPELTAIGNQAVVTVSLEDYTSASIAGLQVDITGFDADVLGVVEYESLIQDDTAESNKASYNTDQDRVRLLYFRTSGSLAPCEDVLKLVVQINPDLAEAGSITLPVTVKIVTVDSQQITLSSGCTIRYQSIADGAVASNTTTGASYFSADDALRSAKVGETVALLKNTEESLVVVPAGVSLDLNGYVVEAANVVAFGSVIDTEATVGGIRISNDTTQAFTKLQPENGGYLPIYDTRDGMYKFFKYELENVGKKFDDTSVTYAFKITMDNMNGYEVLANTGDSEISLHVNFNWDGLATGSGFTHIAWRVSDATVREYGRQSYESGKTSKVIMVGLSGVDNLKAGDQITAAPVLNTTAEVSAVNEPIVYTKP